MQNVTVARDGNGLRVEVTLSAPVQPSIETAVNPDRILLDFPGTISTGNTQKEVDTDGVRRVRTGQHSTVPPVTRVVLDLDQAHSYTMRAEGNRIIVTVGPALNASRGRSSTPAPPVSLGLSGIFRRRSDAPQSTTTDQSASIPSPPTMGPVPPPASAHASASATTASVATSAPVSTGQDSPPRRLWVAQRLTPRQPAPRRLTPRRLNSRRVTPHPQLLLILPSPTRPQWLRIRECCWSAPMTRVCTPCSG